MARRLGRHTSGDGETFRVSDRAINTGFSPRLNDLPENCSLIGVELRRERRPPPGDDIRHRQPRRIGPKIAVDEANFRWAMNEDAMATEKLAEGIRAFAKDLGALRAMVAAKLG